MAEPMTQTEPPSPPAKADHRGRPRFLERLSEAYSLRRKNIAILTGDTYGLFWSPKSERFSSLDRLFHRELGEKFNLVRINISQGLSFYDFKTESEVIRICESKDGQYIPPGRMKSFKGMIDSSRNNPLSALVLLQGITEAFARNRELEPACKPLCAVFHFAGALFPPGDYSRLSELDRQRLVAFLSWVSSPDFVEGPDLIILINHVKAEINPKIFALPNGAHVEIDLPNQEERLFFVERFIKVEGGVRFAGGRERFAEDTAGLGLNNIKDMMEVAVRSRKTVSRDQVVKEVNTILQAQLGDIIRIKYPSHGPEDIIGHRKTGQIFSELFKRNEDPETAVAALLVSGPNGGGKTFQLEAYAAQSGRVVIELAGIRGSLFGETDRFFELLRWHITTFGKILILVDEAHTAFGSIHSSDTHQTEQRLSGNIIKMMGDPTYLGKVFWALMTSRPDELDPDIKSRAPVQVPIFDMEGEERRDFVREMLRRKGLTPEDGALDEIMTRTAYYSARDYRNFVAEVLAQRRSDKKRTALEVLNGWQASKSINKQRFFQEVIAALHCSYPDLLPERFAALSDEELSSLADELKQMLRR